jgi:hypothetical protein
VTGRIARALTRLYSPEWQARYGEEFTVLLEALPARPEVLFDALAYAAKTRRRSLALGALTLASTVLLSSAATSFEAPRGHVVPRTVAASVTPLACHSYSSATRTGWIARQACLD